MTARVVLHRVWRTPDGGTAPEPILIATRHIVAYWPEDADAPERGSRIELSTYDGEAPTYVVAETIKEITERIQYEENLRAARLANAAARGWFSGPVTR